MSTPVEIGGINIEIDIIRGRNLVAKDKNLLTRRKTTSDPYVNVYCGGKYAGKTKVVYKNLNPTWNQKIKIKLGKDEATHLFSNFQSGGHQPQFELHIFDFDEMSDDDSMGRVVGILPLSDPPSTNWYPVEKNPGKSKPVSGELEVKISVSIQKMVSAIRGNSMDLGANGSGIQVSLQWQLANGSKTDLDTSCVAVDRFGQVLMDETVYFGDIENSNRSICHSGDEQYGGGKGEIIRCKLDSVRQHVKALYFLLTIATPGKSFEDVKSASIMVSGESDKYTLCKFTPSLAGDHTAMFLMRITRKEGGYGWTMTVIEDSNHTARDFGTLIPEIKGYSRDFAPNIVIDPRERIAVMRKGGAIRIRDYLSPSQPLPNKVTFGLAWDVTNGMNIDLDASAICLDSSLNLIEIVYFKHLRSNDNTIIHGGDEREGDEAGDDEKIHLYLNDINPNVAHIGFVINSYSGQELDDISKASCHLFDSETKKDIARYQLTANRALDKHTGLVMSSLYRENGAWCLRIIAEAAHGRVASELVDELQAVLRRNPPPPPAVVPESDIVVNEMPEDVEIVVEPVVPMHEVANDIVIPVPTAPSQPTGSTSNNGIFVPTY